MEVGCVQHYAVCSLWFTGRLLLRRISAGLVALWSLGGGGSLHYSVEMLTETGLDCQCKVYSSFLCYINTAKIKGHICKHGCPPDQACSSLLPGNVFLHVLDLSHRGPWLPLPLAVLLLPVSSYRETSGSNYSCRAGKTVLGGGLQHIPNTWTAQASQRQAFRMKTTACQSKSEREL